MQKSIKYALLLVVILLVGIIISTGAQDYSRPQPLPCPTGLWSAPTYTAPYHGHIKLYGLVKSKLKTSEERYGQTVCLYSAIATDERRFYEPSPTPQQ